MSLYKVFAGISGAILLALLLGPPPSLSVESPSPAQPSVFFSQGQALFQPQDRSKSQKDATQDFIAQAIMQAAATVFSPAEMGERYSAIQDQILSQRERYVKNYQIFSENAGEGGLYRVTGQVAVNMEALRRDLTSIGNSQTVRDGRPVAPLAVDASPVEPGKPDQQSENKEATRESTEGSGIELLWVVSEKWDQEWFLVQDKNDSEGLFAVSVLDESRDYDWSMLLPAKGTLALDHQGVVARGPLLAQARALGVQHAIVGTVGLREGQGEAPRLDVSLNVLHAASGKSQGEVRREWRWNEGSNQEAAMELAALIVPQLDRLMRAKSGTEPTAGGSIPRPSEAGELVLQITSRDGYAHWPEMEKVLREQFKNMQVLSLVLGSNGTVVRLMGVEAAFVRQLHGAQLPSGLKVGIVRAGSDSDNSIDVTLERPGTTP
jgi:hypothetical protein